MHAAKYYLVCKYVYVKVLATRVNEYAWKQLKRTTNFVYIKIVTRKL